MAQIDVQTWEANSTTANVLGGDIFNAAIGTTHARTGTYACQVTSLSSATPKGYLKKWLSSTAAGPYFLRIGIYVVTLPSASNTIMQFNGASGSLGTTARSSITLESNGTLILRNATGTQIGSASAAINDSAYHIVELKHDGTGGTNLKTLEAKLDGTIFATSSTQNQGNPLAYSIGMNLASEAQTTGEVWFDDIALNDTTGSFQTGYPGVSNVVRALVNGAGDANGFLVQVGGTVGSSNNYTRVNEVPPDDATSYNASAVLNAEDLFLIDVSGVPTTATINAVLVGVRAADITASDTTTGIKLEMMKASGGTKAQSANIVPNSTAWSTNGTSTPRNYQLVLYQDPDGTNWNPATWTPQIGYTIDATAVRAIGITNIWAEINFTPSAGTTTSTSTSISTSSTSSSTSISTSSTSTSISTSSTSASTSISTSSTSTSVSTSSTSTSVSTSSTSASTSISTSSTSTSVSTSSTSSSISTSSTSTSTTISFTTSTSSTSTSVSTSTSLSTSSTSSSTSISTSSTSSSTSTSSTSSSISTSSTSTSTSISTSSTSSSTSHSTSSTSTSTTQSFTTSTSSTSTSTSVSTSSTSASTSISTSSTSMSTSISTSSTSASTSTSQSTSTSSTSISTSTTVSTSSTSTSTSFSTSSTSTSTSHSTSTSSTSTSLTTSTSSTSTSHSTSTSFSTSSTSFSVSTSSTSVSTTTIAGTDVGFQPRASSARYFPKPSTYLPRPIINTRRRLK